MQCRGEFIIKTFWDRLEVGVGPDPCWVWTGARCRDGYGQVFAHRKYWSTHRLAYTLAKGPIPSGLEVVHQCDNRPCCRPCHLFLGTHAQNMDDMSAKGRHGQCKLTPDQVRTIRSLYPSQKNQYELATMFGVGQQTISFIVRGKIWRHV